MTIIEVDQDLFTLPKGFVLAHCVSADFALGAGIAKRFNEVYDMRRQLVEAYTFSPGMRFNPGVVGAALRIGDVFNLVTKERCFHKPTYSTLRMSLTDMRDQLIVSRETKLAIPRIGCGLDRLQWPSVRSIIEEVFEDTDVEIAVCVWQPGRRG